MAVRTSDVALVDFGLNSTPGKAAPEHVGDIRAFVSRAGVVEVEDGDVGFATVDAWMRMQVGQYGGPQRIAVTRMADARLVAVVLLVSRVVLALVRASALFAIPASATGRGISEVEFS
ncbi:MAG TPA: hypothetical protein VGL99_24220 [Chloroflexota bacterium]